jgi:hypothetical protein
MGELFCIRCGRGFPGGQDRVLCDECAGPGAAGPAVVVTAAGGRSFPSEGEVPAEWLYPDPRPRAPVPMPGCHSQVMAHAIEMFFDDRADSAVRALWLLMAEAGLPSLATRSHRRHPPAGACCSSAPS